MFKLEDSDFQRPFLYPKDAIKITAQQKGKSKLQKWWCDGYRSLSFFGYLDKSVLLPSPCCDIIKNLGKVLCLRLPSFRLLTCKVSSVWSFCFLMGTWVMGWIIWWDRLDDKMNRNEIDVPFDHRIYEGCWAEKKRILFWIVNGSE